MAQSGYTPILIYGSGTATNVPLAANLTSSASGAELALNYADGKLYFKNSSGVVTLLAGSGGGPAGGSNTQVQYNSSGSLAGSANMVFDGSTLTTLNSAYTGTLTGGTGVVNLGSGQFYKDASGNVGIGVTPSAWNTTTAVTALQLPNGSLMTYSNAYGFSNIYLSANAYLNSSGNWIFTKTNSASLYSQTDRQHTWYYAASGTAGTQITFTQAMTLDASGNLGIGTTSPSASAILDAQSTTKGVRMPNMTTTQKNAISSPAAGLMVFDTILAKLCVYSGSAWQTITSV